MGHSEASIPVDVVRRVDNINPSMAPEEVLGSLKDYRVLREQVSSQDRVLYQAREEMLRRYGIDPDGWVYYRDYAPRINGQMTEEDHLRISAALPADLEILSVPGSVSWVDRMVGISGLFPQSAPYVMVWEHQHSVFIRLKQGHSS